LYDLSDESGDEDNLRYEDFFSSKEKSKSKSLKLEADGSDDESDLEDDGSDMLEESEDLEDGSGGEEGSEDEDEGQSEEGYDEEQNQGPTTSYGKEKQKMQRQIADIESQLMEAKSWERKGEVKSGDRPENSLLGLAVAVERSCFGAFPFFHHLF
jgi:U3 small nucleolar ribonucleoprotein component